MKAVIWTKTTCFYCIEAKKLLEKLSIDYEERNIDTDWQKKDLLKVVPHARTVPQIFIDNKLIGGYTDLVDYVKSL